MDLNLSAEQKLLKDSVDAFAREYLLSRRKASMSAQIGFSPDVWFEMVELGWLGVELAEEAGGYGGSAVDTIVIHEGIGLGLIVEPLLSTVTAARLIAATATARQRQELLSPILDGTHLAVLAHHEADSGGDPEFIGTIAKPAAAGWVLHGRKAMVVDAPSSDVVVLSAKLDETGELLLAAVDTSRLAGCMRPCHTIDGLRAADIQLDGFAVSAAERLNGDADIGHAVAAVIDHGRIAMAAQALGVMEAALAMTAEYLGTRKQFGVAIGTFQALQHKLADMVVAVELARSILLYGVAALAEPDPEQRARGVAGALVRVIESADTIGNHAIQLHGGIGVTEEHLISHYFRKLAMLKLRMGGTDFNLARFGSPRSGRGDGAVA
jgi:alkylation response protein AidB-like acyl-CoA dehydrogenase